MIALDARVLIAYLDAEDAQHEAAERLLAQEVDDDFVANPLMMAEVLVGPSRTGRLDAARSALRELEVAEQPFPVETAVRLARCGPIRGCGCRTAASFWPLRMPPPESRPSMIDSSVRQKISGWSLCARNGAHEWRVRISVCPRGDTVHTHTPPVVRG